MNKKNYISKIVSGIIWVSLFGLVVYVFIAAVQKEKGEICKGLQIDISSSKGKKSFLTELEVKKIIESVWPAKMEGSNKLSIPIRDIENAFYKNKWIDSVETYFDGENKLHLLIAEARPISRIFTQNGNSYFLTSKSKKIPVSSHYVVVVPVFTNVPDALGATTDSLLLEDVRMLSSWILKDSFWNAMIAQIVVDVDSKIGDHFEMKLIPLVGNHTVKMGHCEDLEKKFGRLKLFYQKVFEKAGFEKYGQLDVRFVGQVVATPKQMQSKDGTALAKIMAINKDTVLKIKNN